MKRHQPSSDRAINTRTPEVRTPYMELLNLEEVLDCLCVKPSSSSAGFVIVISGVNLRRKTYGRVVCLQFLSEKLKREGR